MFGTDFVNLSLIKSKFPFYDTKKYNDVDADG